MSLREGQQVASYRLLEKVGQGGMGVVWKALDTRLDRQVALKFLPETFETDPERFARFVREAKALAALNLPTVVTVHAVEEIDGRPFIVMEYVRGRTLDDITPETGLPLDRFLSLAIALADAVGAAHECGINHGDLKPANIMVDERGQPKILDFGLASWLQPPVDTDTSEVLTRTLPTSGQIVGSVCYMSPEQASGKPTDHRSDLFSLGVILYKLATG
ncbi:MAG: serine/threonine protein kinase, partial [Acidobacteriota bacterium]